MFMYINQKLLQIIIDGDFSLYQNNNFEAF